MMTDTALCRRALREIGEIAAVSVLDDSQMSELEALESIAAIASWVRAEPRIQGPACRAAIIQIHRLTADADLDRLDDAQVHAKFKAVLSAIQGDGGDPIDPTVHD